MRMNERERECRKNTAFLANPTRPAEGIDGSFAPSHSDCPAFVAVGHSDPQTLHIIGLAYIYLHCCFFFSAGSMPDTYVLFGLFGLVCTK